MYQSNILERLVKDKVKFSQLKYTFIGIFIVGIITHGYIMTHNFVNSDGIYYFYSENMDMTVSGRWLLNLICKISGDYTIPWFLGILSMLYIAVGTYFLIMFFDIRNEWNILVVSGIIVASPVVTATFGYMFTADAYFFSYALATFAAYMIKKFELKSPFFWVGVAAICLSMGIYQAYVEVTVIMLMLDSIAVIFNTEKLQKCCGIVCRYLIALFMGAFLYFGVLEIILKKKKLQLLSYQGINEVKVIDLKSIIYRIPNLYNDTIMYFRNGELTANNIYILNAYKILAFISMIIAFFYLWRKKSIWKTSFACAVIGIIPIALNMFNLFSDKTINHLLMKMGWVICLLVGFILVDQFDKKLRLVSLLGILIILNYGRIANEVYVNVEQKQEKTYAVCLKLSDRMEQVKGYYEGIPIIIEGEPNDSYSLTSQLPGELYDIPQVSGDFYITDAAMFAYAFRNHIGTAFNYVYDNETVMKIKSSKEWKNMEVWPESESVKIIDGYLCIRFR